MLLLYALVRVYVSIEVVNEVPVFLTEAGWLIHSTQLEAWSAVVQSIDLLASMITQTEEYTPYKQYTTECSTFVSVQQVDVHNATDGRRWNLIEDAQMKLTGG